MARDVFLLPYNGKRKKELEKSIIEVLQVRFNTVPEDIRRD